MGGAGSIVVDRDPDRVGRREARRCSVFFAVGLEDVDAVVAVVGDVEVAGFEVDRHPLGELQRPTPAPGVQTCTSALAVVAKTTERSRVKVAKPRPRYGWV